MLETLKFHLCKVCELVFSSSPLGLHHTQHLDSRSFSVLGNSGNSKHHNPFEWPGWSTLTFAPLLPRGVSDANEVLRRTTIVNGGGVGVSNGPTLWDIGLDGRF